MADILDFSTAASRQERDESRVLSSAGAEVIIFPGVRIDYGPVDDIAEPARRKKRKRSDA